MSRAQVALVTGASRGIGAAIASTLGMSGAHVLVGARDLDACRKVADEIVSAGGRATAVRLDVTDGSSVADALSEGQQAAGGTVSWLVNNAGVAVSAPLLGGGERDLYAHHLDVNFHGARRVTEAVLPAMLEAGFGRIVQIASSAALEGYAYVSAYCASKHALLGYSRAAALELVRKGVSVNVVCPHYVDSPMLEASIANIVEKTGKSESAARAFLAGQNPGGVFVQSEDVARSTRELLEGSRTGAVVELIGGATRSFEPGVELQNS